MSHVDAHVDYTQSRIFRDLSHQHDFWSLCTFLKKHQILSRSLTESLSGNSVKISECREFRHLVQQITCLLLKSTFYANHRSITADRYI